MMFFVKLSAVAVGWMLAMLAVERLSLWLHHRGRRIDESPLSPGARAYWDRWE